ncbi:cysteine hydrolase family protein [Paenibacillus silvisoli]|uniref:cysteine hydrolase family protein n=1 Tax=Paenibacillus silvisoli TaxID=3110539 RepID=UPI0028037BE9|nr:isochorismatase family protein [Paenibacillus silvisoli]
MKIAFFIIDMQAIHLQGVDKKSIDRACEYINHVSGVLRSKDHLIVHIQDVEGMSETNRDGYQTISDIDVKDRDLIVTKESSNAFWQTELEQLLVQHNVEMIVLSGFAAEQCVLFTYNGAAERGFRPVILQNGILSTHSDVITATYRDRNLISYPVIPFLA